MNINIDINTAGMTPAERDAEAKRLEAIAELVAYHPLVARKAAETTYFDGTDTPEKVSAKGVEYSVVALAGQQGRLERELERLSEFASGSTVEAEEFATQIKGLLGRVKALEKVDPSINAPWLKLSDITDRLDDLETQIKGLLTLMKGRTDAEDRFRKRLTKLEARLEEMDATTANSFGLMSERVSGIDSATKGQAKRIKGLEDRLAKGPCVGKPDPEAMLARIAALELSVEKLERRPEHPDTARALTAFGARIDALETRTRGAEFRLAKVETPPTDSEAHLTATARALDMGRATAEEEL